MPAPAEHVAARQDPRRRQPSSTRARRTLLEVQVARQPAAARHRASSAIRDPRRDAHRQPPVRARRRARDQARRRPRTTRVQTLFKGEIVALEPEFRPAAACIVASAPTTLAPAATASAQARTFQNMTAADIVKKVASEAASAPATIDERRRRPRVRPAEQRDRLGLHLAARASDRLRVRRRRQQARTSASAGERPAARRRSSWRRERCSAFRPRMTGVQQVDEVDGRAAATRRPSSRSTASAERAQHDRRGRRSARATVVGDARRRHDCASPTASSPRQAEADALAQSDARPARQRATSRPRASRSATRSIKAGAQGQDRRASAAVRRHVHASPRPRTSTAAASGYQTRFAISGRSPRTLLDLIAPAGSERDWVGVARGRHRDQQQRPRRAGPRAREVPGARRRRRGAGWARDRDARAPARTRGLLMLPQVDDEVLVGFEHGDTRRPYRARLALQRQGQARRRPAAADATARSRSQSDEKIHIEAKKDFAIKTDENMVDRDRRRTRREGQGRLRRTRRPARSSSRRQQSRRGRVERDRSRASSASRSRRAATLDAQGRDGGHPGLAAP